MTRLSVLAHHKRFRRLFLARTISNLGNGVAPIAIAFGVLGLEGADASTLSIVLVAQAIPLLVVLPFGGVIADRVGRARVIGVTDTILGIDVLVIGALFVTGHASLAWLVPLQVIAGVLNGLWYPAFGGITADVVEEEHLQKANAFISIGSNSAAIAGAALGGVLVATIGAGPAILVDATSFILAGLLVWSIRYVSKPASSGENVLGDLLHGWRVFISFRWVVAVVLAFSFIVMCERAVAGVVGPVAAKQWYDGPSGWAVITGAEAVGLLVGGIAGSRFRPSRPLVVGCAMTLTSALYFVCLGLGLPLGIVAAAAFSWGLTMDLFFVLWFTAMQTHIPRESLSRVSSYDAFGSLMFGPIGLALAGPMLAGVGVTTTLLIAAGIVTVSVVGALCVRSVRELTWIDAA